jgi:hypothetical protein
VEAKN